jgi:hypothetical protein
MVSRRGRAESRPGFGPVVIVLFLSYQGDVWVEGGEASSAGHGQEAGKLGHVYMPWPQSGRMQYEENKKKMLIDVKKKKRNEKAEQAKRYMYRRR